MLPQTPNEILIFSAILALVFYLRRGDFKKALQGRRKPAASIQKQVGQGFTQLVDLLLHNSHKESLRNFIANWPQQNQGSDSDDPETIAVAFLAGIREYLYEQDTRFITYIDWKESVRDVLWHIELCIGVRAGQLGSLTSISEVAHTSISAPGVFLDISRHLAQAGIRLAYLDDLSDAYHIFLYDIDKQKAVESALRLIGLRFRYELD